MRNARLYRNTKVIASVFLIFLLLVFVPFKASASSDAEVADEIQKVNSCFENSDSVAGKLDCMFTDTFLTYFLIPAIIVFALVYGLIRKLKLFESKEVSMLLGLAVALLVMFNADQLADLGKTVTDLGPGPIIMLLFLLVIILSGVKKGLSGSGTQQGS